jgi:hypothetical protein
MDLVRYAAMATGGTPAERRRWLGPVVVALIVLSAAAALSRAAPDRLPSAALGSDVVLFVERGAAVFAVLFLALLVIYRAFRGELPSELSGRGVKYADADAVDQLRAELTDAISKLRQNQEDLKDSVNDLLGDPGDQSTASG